jgi:molybdopterin-guanine dinucleotide biosynthesis protein A
LFHAAEHCGQDCLIPYAPPDRPQPLCAVYHRNCLPAIERAIRDNVRKVKDVVSRLDACAWPVAGNTWFRNLNTPEDLVIHV